MRQTSRSVVLALLAAIFLLPGCASVRPTDILLGTAALLVSAVLDSDGLDDPRDHGRNVQSRKREWQRNNLSESELEDLGIRK